MKKLEKKKLSLLIREQKKREKNVASVFLIGDIDSLSGRFFFM